MNLNFYSNSPCSQRPFPVPISMATPRKKHPIIPTVIHPRSSLCPPGAEREQDAGHVRVLGGSCPRGLHHQPHLQLGGPPGSLRVSPSAPRPAGPRPGARRHQAPPQRGGEDGRPHAVQSGLFQCFLDFVNQCSIVFEVGSVFILKES